MSEKDTCLASFLGKLNNSMLGSCSPFRRRFRRIDAPRLDFHIKLHLGPTPDLSMNKRNPSGDPCLNGTAGRGRQRRQLRGTLWTNPLALRYPTVLVMVRRLREELLYSICSGLISLPPYRSIIPFCSRFRQDSNNEYLNDTQQSIVELLRVRH